MKNYLLFDLDGTLTDPKVGICTCVQYALASFGIEEPDIDKLEPFIGPPLKDSFMQFYNMSDEQAEKAVAKYRERFNDTGIFENKVYDGIPQMLETLNRKGMFMAVASSKPTVFVERILEHFGIRKYFKAVVGSELDGTRVNKDEVVQEALRQLFGEQPIEKNKVYMIGDRKFDVEGARAEGVDSVGVTYGYGDMEELREARADYIVRSVEELQRFLLRGTEDVKKGLDTRGVWQFAFPFLLFMVVRQIATILTASLYGMLGGKIGSLVLATINEEEQTLIPTPNGIAILQLVGFVAAAAAIWKTARMMITKTAESEKLLHIKREPGSSYGFLALATLGFMLGANMLLDLTGITDNSAAYKAVAESQYSANIFLSLVLFVLISPLAEELLFRGIIYNCLRRMLKPAAAMIIAAMFFGIYHGNSVQGAYGVLMSCLFIYGYEYFGDFKVPVIMHAMQNLISFLLGSTVLAVSGFVCWPVCILFLAMGAAGLFLLNRRKKVF